MTTSETMLLAQDERKDLLRFVTAGSVDDGKSTLIGRLLFESRGIYEDQLDAVRKASGRKGLTHGQLDLSLVTDGLKAEREQGITIDVAYRYFSTPRRKFIIADTPGHEQYTRNMATGASTASAAIILVDASRGLTTQSRRHAFIASLLGISHLVVTINKMDLVGYSQAVFDRIREEMSSFAARLEAIDTVFIPISALAGDNVVRRSEHMPWYQGSTLLNHLETVHVASDRNLIDLRFPVQYVTRAEGGFRGYLGTIASGVIRPGDEVLVLPACTRTRVRIVYGPDGELTEGFAPMAVGVTLAEQVDVSRGNMLVHVHNVPRIGHTLEAMLVWMGAQPMHAGRNYLLKHTTNTVAATVNELRYRVDVNTVHRCQADALNMNEIGRAVLTLAHPIAYDPYRKNRSTGPFVLIDRVSNETVAAGMILDREPEEFIHSPADGASRPRSEHVTRQEGLVTPAQRSARLGHVPATVWLTGLTGSGKTTIAYALEKRLFDEGRACC
ncbi:MAG: sulfate adenylyltransferase subunit CysN, partial [Phycisphaerae bacterium]|nr:sulfate adenylyltransferase subunit CysN [Phycisphaerae bacterium]